jgi:hypothetical protein
MHVADSSEYQIARLCVELEAGLAQVATSVGARDLLDDLLEALRAGGDPSRLLDRLDEELRRGGVPGGLGLYEERSIEGYSYIRPYASGGAIEEVFTCPTRTCPRVEASFDDVAGTPRCAVHRMRMRRVRLNR